MKVILYRTTFWIVGLASCAGVGWYVYRYSITHAQQSAPQSSSARLAVVEICEVRRRDLIERIEFIGILEAKAQFTIRARTDGYVRRLPFDLADNIRPRCGKLPVVVNLEDAAYRIRLKSTKAGLQEANAQLRIDQSNLLTAEKQHERMMSAKLKDAVTDSQVEESEAVVKAAKSQVELDQARIARAQAAVEQAKIELEKTRVFAPSAGVVSQRFVEIGDHARPGDPLLRMIDISSVTCVVRVVERDYPRLSVGQKADVRIDAFGETTFTGRVARKSPQLDELRTAAVHIEIDNPNSQLKPGMHGRISVVVRNHRNTYVVPADSLVWNSRQPSLFVVNGDPPKAELRHVEVGVTDGEFVQILSGVSLSDRVVTTGSHLIKNGQRVKTEIGRFMR